jgi:hypothetical protein
LFDSVVAGSFGFSGCFLVVFLVVFLLRLGAVFNGNFFNRASPDSSRDVLVFRGDRAVVASSSQAGGLFCGRIEDRKLEPCFHEKLPFLSCQI